ncbi:MAG: GMC family oxidoreductase [Variovorax sp.]
MTQLPKGFTDGREVPDGTRFEADICIVGAGPVGLSMAEELTSRGFMVCLVESGGFEPDAAVNELSRGEMGGDRSVDPAGIRTRQFGGLSNVWSVIFDRPRIGVRYVPFDPIDFEERPEIPHSGWPFPFSDMAPWYEQAHRVCELGAYDYDGASRATEEAGCIESPDGELKTSFFQFGPAERFYARSRDILADSGRAQVLLHTSALELDVSEDETRVVGLRAGCLNGKRMSIQARSYVLATGAIENARLMLLSNSRNPAGVGNSHDVVGRYLMDHPQDYSSYIVPKTRAIFDKLTMYDLRPDKGVGYMAKFSFTEEAIKKHNLLNMTFLVIPLEATSMSLAVNSFRALVTGRSRFKAPDGLAGKIAAMATDPFSIVKHLYRFYATPGVISSIGYGGWSKVPNKARMFVDHIEVMNQLEQYPHRDNRVTLGESVDAFGQRRLRYEFSWREEDQARFVRSRQHFVRLAEEAGLGTYKFDSDQRPTIPTSHHPMGTTRMHTDPAQGVVDADCKVHGMDNLFIAGASVFPTGGYANPTLSAIALGLRLAAFLALVVPFLEAGGT